MSAMYARVTPSLPCGNPNASQTDKRPVQLTRMDKHETRTDRHVDNPTHRSVDRANLLERTVGRCVGPGNMLRLKL